MLCGNTGVIQLEHTEQLPPSALLGAQRAAPVEQRLPRSKEGSSTGAHGAAAHWEQIKLLQAALWSICFPGAQRAAMLEHMEQQLFRSRYSCSSGADTAAPVEHYGAAASLEHKEQLYWSLEHWLSESRYTAALLLHVHQQSYSLCSREAAAPCAPVKQLYQLAESCSFTCSRSADLCAPGSREATASCAAAEQLYLLPASCCSTGSSRAALVVYNCKAQAWQ